MPRVAERPAGRLAVLTRPIGGRTGDRVLRVTGAVALAAAALALISPAAAALLPFVLVTMWTNGPHSPVLPAAYEPVLLLYGRLYPPLLIGGVGTVGTVCVEWINYHLYARAAEHRHVRGVWERPAVRRVLQAFRRWPFWTIVLSALTPLPYWVARTLSAASRYPLWRHLTATALGRFPRLWCIAALGAPLAVPLSWLVAATLITTAGAMFLFLLRRSYVAVAPAGPR